ncbi:30S ribosomal protein S17 [Candidatus Woesearchaeota archaeon]|nr:30S ribosomal protein S17 [Candidatus Woesearchaeota archaeon]
MAKTESRNIGTMLEAPKQKCSSAACPFHGNLSIRGRQFTGIVVSTKMRKTAVVEFNRLHFLKKYERYEKRRTKLKVHNPECINAKDGDIVKMMECRPLSKTKNFVIIEKMGVEKGFKEKMEARELGKITIAAKTEDEAKSKEE